MAEPQEEAHGNGGSRPAPVATEAADPGKKRRTRLRIIAGVAVLAVAALIWWLHARKFEDTDDAQVDAYISAVSSRVTGTVIRVVVEDNQVVKQGDLLA